MMLQLWCMQITLCYTLMGKHRTIKAHFFKLIIQIKPYILLKLSTNVNLPKKGDSAPYVVCVHQLHLTQQSRFDIHRAGKPVSFWNPGSELVVPHATMISLYHSPQALQGRCELTQNKRKTKVRKEGRKQKALQLTCNVFILKGQQTESERARARERERVRERVRACMCACYLWTPPHPGPPCSSPGSRSHWRTCIWVGGIREAEINIMKSGSSWNTS